MLLYWTHKHLELLPILAPHQSLFYKYVRVSQWQKENTSPWIPTKYHEASHLNVQKDQFQEDEVV